ncbi:MAG: type II toxin-antitoxin system RelE/ParE family toxin [Planctomycetes bacterium]|nr:type II toxin-antitoxin system RelE/ParE family toxin [Planctomycetota bacterium]
MRLVPFCKEADAELIEAAVWYDGQRGGLGKEFLDDAEQTLSLVVSLPRAWPRIRDAPLDLEIRRALLRRFPYAIVYQVQEERIRVLAVAHQKREPNYWLNRVQP